MAFACTVGPIALSDANAANANLPSGVFIGNSIVKFSIPVSWSGGTSGVLPRISLNTVVYSAQIDDYELVDVSYYQLVSGEDVSGSHTFELYSNSMDVDLGFSGDYGSFTVDSTLTFGGSQYYSEVKPFNKYSYSVPSISAFSARRCTQAGVSDDSGTYAKIDVTYIVNALGNNNTKALTIKYKKTADSNWSSETIDISDLGYADAVAEKVLAGTFEQTYAYDVRAEITDLLNTIPSSKTITPATALMHFNANKDGIGVGQYSTGPGFQLAMNLLLNAAKVTAFLGSVMPCIVMSSPITSEDMIYNATARQYMLRWQTVVKNGTFETLKGASGGTYDVGATVPSDGLYLITFNMQLEKASSNSKATMRIHVLPSTWAMVTSRNYLVSSEWSSELHEVPLGCEAFSDSNTFGGISVVLSLTAGSFILPTIEMASASKTLNGAHTFFSIQKVG